MYNFAPPGLRIKIRRYHINLFSLVEVVRRRASIRYCIAGACLFPCEVGEKAALLTYIITSSSLFWWDMGTDFCKVKRYNFINFLIQSIII